MTNRRPLKTWEEMKVRGTTDPNQWRTVKVLSGRVLVEVEGERARVLGASRSQLVPPTARFALTGYESSAVAIYLSG